MSEMVVFETGNIQFALDRKCIAHIEPTAAGLKAKKNRNPLKIMTYKGNPLSVIDIAAYLDKGIDAPHLSDAKVVIIKGASDMGLWADSVKGPLVAKKEQMAELPPVFTGTARACFPNVLHLKDRLALVVDVGALASLNQCSHESVLTDETRQMQDTDKQSAAFAAKKGNSNPIAGRSGLNPLEKVVAHKLKEPAVARKLQQIIERHVKRVVARTIAETLKQQSIKLNFN